MNTRIDKIAEQAGLWNDMEPTRREGRYAGYMNVSDVEKFAELVVRECCDWIDGSPSTDAGQLLLTKSFIIANLKGYFGVES